ncbi:DUF3325 domain-containing protein [Aquipseudomonas ullengensis]|uniref:DUF3325 domain-containing protein n=1 Tax=Aquipseudomonas ullengensis TaxID=2759166 RepID=A0A7W4Q912_9GAMM|nr:DUF3325 domain-containing protein [Pseudomonas ullengensis]MBB2494342.1 DUF3325 domain-containing protein [Pseudomonas ullengensis]
MLLGGALCYAGMAALCLGMDRHHRQVWSRTAPRRQRGLRLVGWLLLAVALWPCIRAWGGSVGVVIWFGLLTGAALLLVWLLPYRPKGAAWLMGLSLLGSLPALLWSAG